MGSCLSKKNASSSSTAATIAKSLVAAEEDKPCGDIIQPVINDDPRIKKTIVEVKHEKNQHEQPQEECSLKKEIFVIKHRKSHDRGKCLPPLNLVDANANDKLQAPDEDNESSNTAEKTPTCTKEEVDAILIQCGRFSRSNSSGAGKTISSVRKYSGSKRSYDFDHNVYDDQDLGAAGFVDYNAQKKGNGDVVDDEVDAVAERRQRRERQRQSNRPSSSHGRRRTPSREREQQSQHSRSRERITCNDGSGRRVSRSPGRRSETNPITTSTSTTNATANRPGKMVSVPATVSYLVLDKSNNGVESQPTGVITRTSVKRNVGEAAAPATSRGTASPRSQSPSRYNQQPPSLSRSSSRKGDQSPYRRIPLAELDNNYLQTCSKPTSIARAQSSTKEIEELVSSVQQPAAKATSRILAHVTRCKASGMGLLDNKLIKEQPPVTTSSTTLGGEGSLNLQKVTRSRSFRRSRDLDQDHEAFTNPAASFTTLLLEDIHNFHQKNIYPVVSLPHCVTKACSILEAVADLNSTTDSNLSRAFSDEKWSHPAVKKASDVKDSVEESEVLANDDLTEPSLHKYVTLRRGDGTTGALCGEDMDGQESSGSNSVVGGNSLHWGIS